MCALPTGLLTPSEFPIQPYDDRDDDGRERTQFDNYAPVLMYAREKLYLQRVHVLRLCNIEFATLCTAEPKTMMMGCYWKFSQVIP